jgi:hypothetical protein
MTNVITSRRKLGRKALRPSTRAVYEDIIRGGKGGNSAFSKVSGGGLEDL